MELLRKWLKAFGLLLGILAVTWLAIFLWPVEERPDYAFYRDDDPEVLNIAHGGGLGLAPDATLAAFEASAENGVDVLEYDTHITSDGHLVAIHDATVDRTTNGTGLVNEMTLEEVQALDAGYHWEDEKGATPYRGMGLYIPTVEEVLRTYPDMRHLIEIKDTNKPELYEGIIQELWRLIQETEMENNVMVGSFTHAINERFEEVSGGRIPIGGGEEAIRDFVTKHVPFLNGLAETNFDALQIPVEQEGYDLTQRNILRGAENRNKVVYYWTINDEEVMRDLIEKGADGIMTDYPDVLQSVLAEYDRKED